MTRRASLLQQTRGRNISRTDCGVDVEDTSLNKKTLHQIHLCPPLHPPTQQNSDRRRDNNNFKKKMLSNTRKPSPPPPPPPPRESQSQTKIHSKPNQLTRITGRQFPINTAYRLPHSSLLSASHTTTVSTAKQEMMLRRRMV